MSATRPRTSAKQELILPVVSNEKTISIGPFGSAILNDNLKYKKIYNFNY
jgi:hypothetical protein